MGQAWQAACCQEDWASDRRGNRHAPGLDRTQCAMRSAAGAHPWWCVSVCDSLFELADLWCRSLDPAEYASFLRMIDKWNGAGPAPVRSCLVE